MVLPRHEQVGGAFRRATPGDRSAGRAWPPAAGATNLVTGIADAYMTRCRWVITGQVA